MKRISSRNTLFYKIIFPALMFGSIGIFFFLLLFVDTNKDGSRNIAPLFVLVFMAVFSYMFMKKLFFDLIDEVYDEGSPLLFSSLLFSSLLFKNGGKQVRVNLDEVKNVSYSTIRNPPRVTISLRRSTELGKDLSFVPQTSLLPFKRNKVIDDLIDRIDRARDIQ